MIQPTVGRIVWYKPYSTEGYAVGPMGEASGPDFKNDARCAAIITCVHSERCVNLTVFDANGETHPATSVTLIQPEDEQEQSHGFCEWMPYQVKKPTGSESGEAAAGTQIV
jgi:hypothetical protein